MKIRILAVITALMLLFSLTVSATSYEYNISPGEDFTCVSYGDDMTDIAQKLNMTADELNTYFNKNGLLYLAVSDDTSTQIRLSAFTDNFSSTVCDISHLNEEQLNEFMNSISDNGETGCTITDNNGRKYVTVTNTLNDSGGVYTVTQYVTICDSKTFYLSCYNNGTETSEQVKNIFNNFSLNSVTTEKSGFDIKFLFIVAGIVIFLGLAVVTVISIIKNRNKTTPPTD